MPNVITGTVQDYTPQEVLYRFALDCEEHKQRGTCNHSCKGCRSNIRRYDLPNDMITLLHSGAEIEIEKRLDNEYKRKMYLLNYDNARRSADIVNASLPLLSIAIMILCIIASVYLFKSCMAVSTVSINDTAEIPTVSLGIPYVISPTDMNGDGLVNCIDNALILYSDIRIMYGASRSVRSANGKWVSHLWIRIGNTDFEPSNGKAFDAYKMYPASQRDITEFYWDILANKFRWPSEGGW